MDHYSLGLPIPTRHCPELAFSQALAVFYYFFHYIKLAFHQPVHGTASEHTCTKRHRGFHLFIHTFILFIACSRRTSTFRITGFSYTTTQLTFSAFFTIFVFYFFSFLVCQNQAHPTATHPYFGYFPRSVLGSHLYLRPFSHIPFSLFSL